MNENSLWLKISGRLKEIYIAKDGNDKAFNLEKSIIEEALNEIFKVLGEFYNFDTLEPINRGGSGVIFKINELNTNKTRALKIPRPKTDELVETVKNEIDYLKELKHEYLISILNIGEVETSKIRSYPYFVMEYIEAQSIRKVVENRLSEISSQKELKNLIKWLAKQFHSISSAINYLHENKIIHFDIKPDNILITSNNKAILTDLGFAKKLTDIKETTVVGFTLFYAHPDLRFSPNQMSSKNKVKKAISRSDFKLIYDLYAFGKSMLEILGLIDREFGDGVYEYEFVYMHLSACRMLDGRNLTQQEVDKIIKLQKKNGEISIYKESWLDLTAIDFDGIKYEKMSVIVLDFEKLLGLRNILDNIPELNVYYPKVVQCSIDKPAPFSLRVKRIVEHPVFSRLAFVPQLGMVRYIYPTATHNRLEHSLGVFRNCCLYINALYNDPYNPLFKQLFNEKELKSVMLAALLHDIGHYPLAHELEKSSKSKELKHENLTIKFLHNPTIDKYRNTLKEIIETNDEWGWGIKLENIEKILKKDELQKTFHDKG